MGKRRLQILVPGEHIDEAYFDESSSIASVIDDIAARLGPFGSGRPYLSDQLGQRISDALTLGHSHVIDGQLLTLALEASTFRQRLQSRLRNPASTTSGPQAIPVASRRSQGLSRIEEPVLPFYLVVDTSGSMHESIGQVNSELKKLWRRIRNQPELYDVCYMSIITFDTTARVVQPLTYLGDTENPVDDLSAQGKETNYGAAFALIQQQINADLAALVRPYRPVVYFISDGQPNPASSYRGVKALHAASTYDRGAYPNVVTFGFGDAKAGVMTQVANRDAFIQKSMSAELGEMMEWILKSLIQSLGNRNRPKQAANTQVEDIYESPVGVSMGWERLEPSPA